jgi:hypothetical protein
VSARVQNVGEGKCTLVEDYANEMVDETTDAGNNAGQYGWLEESLDEILKHGYDSHGCWRRE